MNKKLRDKINRLIKVTEDFGFDVGMHNKCFDDALKKRLEKFGEDSEEFATHTLALIETRIRYLKEKSKWWYRDRPEHLTNVSKWNEVIKDRENLEEFLNADLGTILAIKRPGKFSGRDYALKTSEGWVEIIDIITIREVFNAILTYKVWDVEKELLPRFDDITMVYEGFNKNTPRHITDLKSLEIGAVIETSDEVYQKVSEEVWAPKHSEPLTDDFFEKELRDKTIRVL